ncbi:MAG: CPBP family intramembrane metalloprotease [Oscillospiraceae bacterium]|nr:CPBP family intramembrane metalloprotease [Oscillospiraceae bacterium]
MSSEYFYIVNDRTPTGTHTLPDPQNPFDNPSEFHSYQCDYGAIVPEIRTEGFRLPHLPGKSERSRIRRYYNIVGGFLAGHFVIANVAAVVLMLGIEALITVVDRAAVGDLPYNYDTLLADYVEQGSTIMTALSALVYGLCNLLVAILGCSATRIPLPNLFRTKDLTPMRMFGYICVALLLQSATGLAATWLTDLFESAGITLYEADLPSTTTARGTVLMLVYSVIVAPITEELLMRGFVLKNLSRSNQHFGIIMTAFIFGIWHENVAQFLLAFVAGCLFGYMAVKHDSLVPCIICHMVVNLFAELFGIFEDYGLEIGTKISEFVYFGMVIFGIVWLIRLLLTERFPRATVAQQERGIRISLSSPVLLLMLVCHIGAAVLFILQASSII